jgi:sulfite exporter TauE/SafE
MILAGGLVVLLGLNLGGWVGRRATDGDQAAMVPFYTSLPESRTHLPPLAAGLLNGLVPCALVFSVAIRAAATADPVQAGLMMLAFGAGTLPTMVTLSLLGATIGHRVRGPSTRVVGVLVIMLGLWTLYEGYVMYDVIRGLANW